MHRSPSASQMISKPKSAGRARKLFVSALSSFACTGISVYAFWSLFPYIYMYLQGIKNRAELSEDYGFGMLGLFGTVGLAIVLFSLLMLLIYACLTRFPKSSHIHQKLG